jgi:hypothetical protein
MSCQLRSIVWKTAAVSMQHDVISVGRLEATLAEAGRKLLLGH